MKRSLIAIEAAARARGWSIASSFKARLVGWIGRRALAPEEGLCLLPCRSIHTFGMRIPIDVLFVDRDLQIVRCMVALEPGRIAAAASAVAVVELPAGTAAASGLVVGAHLARSCGSTQGSQLK